MENQEFSPSFFRFEDLRVYQKAVDYYTWVQNKVDLFPNKENNALGNKFIIDALQIATKIAEGSSRNRSLFIENLKESKIAIRHCVVYSTSYAKSLHFSPQDLEESRTQLMELTKMLGALISSLQRDNRPNSNHHKPNYNKKNIQDYQNNNY
ncbi:MAG: hypothetical protein B7C24_08015 [Bacteroidetes bacterium 4572_77]|nr:MAG: hypothetical protein B7C24_08015 [Bacteroidetes bacterium 4572_77]